MEEQLHTFTICEKCKQSVRTSRHSEADCATIQKLKVELGDKDTRIAELEANLNSARTELGYELPLTTDCLGECEDD
jgi:predicted RNase H-like nuclease (RuvC/YqgF family)